MFGIIVGTLCLIALIGVVRRGSRWRRFGHHGRHGWGRRHMLRRAYSELRTRPEQEKIIETALADVEAAAQKVSAEVRGSRGDFARILRQEAVHPGEVESLFAASQAKLDELKAAATKAVSEIHQTLDAEQRQTLAQWLERVGQCGGRHGRGPDHQGRVGGPVQAA